MQRNESPGHMQEYYGGSSLTNLSECLSISLRLCASGTRLTRMLLCPLQCPVLTVLRVLLQASQSYTGILWRVIPH